MRIGFIGLGQVGGKLAGNLLANGHPLTVRDLSREAAAPFLSNGAGWADSPAELARTTDIAITCLPSPAACAAVVEGEDGLITGLGPGKIWIEMSTTDAAEVARLAERVTETGAEALECPVSGGCHRAATGNISLFAAGPRETFERAMPVLRTLGRQILHTGPIGTASKLKVMTNYLATANLLTLCEALAVMKAQGLDLSTTYEAIRISSGNSFVHETESQMILSGSRDINFTMDLVLKDIGLFQALADAAGVPLDLSPQVIALMEDGTRRYGPRAQSDEMIRRLEDATGLDIRAPGFPTEMVDDAPPRKGRRNPAKALTCHVTRSETSAPSHTVAASEKPRQPGDLPAPIIHRARTEERTAMAERVLDRIVAIGNLPLAVGHREGGKHLEGFPDRGTVPQKTGHMRRQDHPAVHVHRRHDPPLDLRHLEPPEMPAHPLKNLAKLLRRLDRLHSQLVRQGLGQAKTALESLKIAGSQGFARIVKQPGRNPFGPVERFFCLFVDQG